MEKNKIIKARFVCALTIFGLKKKPIQSLGIVNGKISREKVGKNGFGYDPIFIPNGKNKTFGQMKYFDKLKIDHRMKAYKKIKKFFKIFYFQLNKNLIRELSYFGDFENTDFSPKFIFYKKYQYLFQNYFFNNK